MARKNMYEKFERKETIDGILKKTSKPLRTPEKRFANLPGGAIRRESERHGGKLAEKRRNAEEGFTGRYFHSSRAKFKNERLEIAGSSRKSSGQHNAELLPETGMIEKTEESTSQEFLKKPEKTIEQADKKLPQIQKPEPKLSEELRHFESEVSRIKRIIKKK